MAQESVITIVRFLADHLKQDGIPIERIIIFGSGPVRQINADSDIDIAIISPIFKGKTIFKRDDLTSEAEVACIRKFRIPLDIIMTREELSTESSLIADSIWEGMEVLV